MFRRFGILIVIVAIAVGVFVLRDRMSSNATDLQVGDCFDSPTTLGQTVTDVQHHPCTETHTGEVFAVVKNPAADNAVYPDLAGRRAFVSGACAQPFMDFVGISMDATELDVRYFAPTSDGWTGGDRTFTCYVAHADDSPFTATVKGTRH
jgi:hypothetical protein